MKSLIFFSLLLFCPISDHQQLGNPRYDFPELIIAKNEKQGHAHAKIDANMEGLSIAGYYHESVQYEDTLLGPKEPVRLALAHKRIMDARAFILKEAKKYRVLLINEAHNRPQHRLFTKSLLKELYAQGYNVFMAEGISMKNSLDSKGYPVSSDGVYISEPNYASLIRYAGNIGYKVRAYEHYGKLDKPKYWDDSIKLDKYGSIKYISYEPKDSTTQIFDEHGLKHTILTNVREKGQANNIFKVIRENPHSKFVIHVGWGHLYESGPMMGAQLRELLNQEDVLTISQTEFDDRATVMDTLSNDTIKRNFSYLLWDSASNRSYHFYNGAQVDYTIFNAEVKDSLLRPDFLFHDVEKRMVYSLPPDQLKDCPCLFSAYYENEYEQEGPKSVAVDVVYIKNDLSRPPLLLYKGSYMAVKKNKAGKYFLFKIEIK